MPRKDDEDVAKLKEVNRLLTFALEQCNNMLARAERHVSDTGQDNEPSAVRREN